METRKNETTAQKGWKVIQITERKCSDSIQPEIQTGDKYFVHDISQLKDGTTVLLLVDWKKSTKGKVKTFRCNAKRFGWRTYTHELAREEQLKEEAKKSYEELLHSFTFNEHMQIAFIPHILINCAWKYTDKVLELAAKDQISETRKLSRTVKMLHTEYDREIAKDLDKAHTDQVMQQTERFMNENARDFLILEMSVRREVLKVAPNDPYMEMTVAAFTGMLMCDAYKNQTITSDKMIAERLGKDRETVLNPKIMALRDCLDAYTGELKIDMQSRDLQLCMKILERNLQKIDFRIEHEKRIANA